MKKVERFFWWCSGANTDLLEKCPTDSGKYVGIGGTILFTGIFAFFAGAYALYTAFDNFWIALIGGLFWGAMIFNLDRFIVSSMRKEGNAGKELLTALPRIILAVIISLVIAKPLEMKLFEKEIRSELTIMEEEIYTQRESDVKSRFVLDRARLMSEIESLKAEILNKTQKRDELMQVAREEADGTGGTMQRNAGPIYKIKKAEAERVEAELIALRENNENLIKLKYKEIENMDAMLNATIAELEKERLDGPAGRMEALNRLTAKNNAIWWANWFIIVLFIVVETAPIFVKLISSQGPYDHLLKTIEFGFESERAESLAKVNATIKDRSNSLSEKEKDYITDRLDMGLERS